MKLLATYYTVPGDYTQDFENKRDATFEEAQMRALARVKPLGRGLDGYTRAFVDERVIIDNENRSQTDRIARRWEIDVRGNATLDFEDPVA